MSRTQECHDDLTRDFDLRIVGTCYEAEFSTNFQNMIFRLAETTPALREVVEDRHRIVTEGSDRIACLRLKFQGDREITPDNDECAVVFCCALIDMANHDLILTISQYSILGFSATTNSFGSLWNIIAVDTMVKDGGVYLEQLHDVLRKPSKDKYVMWCKIAGMVANTVVGHCFDLNKSLYRGNAPQNLCEAIRRANEWKSGRAYEILQGGIRFFSDAATSFQALVPEAERKEAARRAYQEFHTLSSTIGTRVQQTSAQAEISEQLAIYVHLYQLQECLCGIFSSTEELMNLYERYRGESSAAATLDLLSAGIFGAKAIPAFQAAAILRESAKGALENVATEGVFTQAGRVLGVVTRETPLQLATKKSAKALAAATELTSSAWSNSIASALTIGSALYHIFAAVRAHRQKEICRKLNTHNLNLAVLAVQTRTSLTWVHIVNGRVEFVDDARNAWEQYVRQKYQVNGTLAQLSPEAVVQELRDCASYLDRHRVQIQEDHPMIF